MTEISLLDFADSSGDFALAPFFCDGQKIDGAKWGMSLLKAGTMRFRWNEKNPNRDEFFLRVFPNKIVSSVELIHSKIVVESKVENDTNLIRADGIATKNEKIVPVVTVADCVPIFLFDAKTKARCVVHSGWKGTGIAAEGVSFLKERFGSNENDIFAAIGAHICENCYRVDEERREIFARDFGKESVKGECLSLTAANVGVLLRAGVPEKTSQFQKIALAAHKKMARLRLAVFVANPRSLKI